MSASRTENSSNDETKNNAQTFVLILVAAVAGLLILIPLLPAWVTNVAYSFSGQSPKIYWYLSRAAGFAALTILWVAMALGLSITNKMARLWPGAPAAFAIHEYVSLLGLAFAMYHALVLMGDHYVDFSLPRLLSPFSIAYETFWVGLGQLCFYAWVVVVLSFYVRKAIGPKVWRAIHYVNFATYLMAISHGIFSGTDSSLPWANWYYALSASSLILLAVYRVYDARLKKAMPGIRQTPWTMVQNFSLTIVYSVVPGILMIAKKAPRAFLSENSPLLLNLAAAAAPGNMPDGLQQEALPASSVPSMPVSQPAPTPAEDLTAPDDRPESLSQPALPVSILPVEPVDQPAPEERPESLSQNQVVAQDEPTAPALQPLVVTPEPVTRPWQAPQPFDPIELELLAARQAANKPVPPVKARDEREIKRELERAPILRSPIERIRQSNLG